MTVILDMDGEEGAIGSIIILTLHFSSRALSDVGASSSDSEGARDRFPAGELLSRRHILEW